MNDELKETAPAPETPVDAGSQALSEALRSSFAIVRFLMVILLTEGLGLLRLH